VSEVDWPGYLSSFHGERAGITEDVLEHARDQSGRTPYAWAALAVPTDAVVLDVACGSGPMASHLKPKHYVGLDLSRAELAAAAAKGIAVAQADATRLPVADSSVDAVVMSMALMLVPLAQTLAEVRRVLRPGGVFVATVPHSRPMPPADWLRYARLFLALRQAGLSYPNDASLAHPEAVFQAAGLRLTEDDRRAFVCHIAHEHVADRLLASMYLPGVAAERMTAGRKVVRRWTDRSVTTPIRRLVARR